MHKKEATRVLTAELVRHSGISIVREDLYKKELIKKSTYFHQFSNPVAVDYKYHNLMLVADEPGTIPSGWYFSNPQQYIKKHRGYTTLEGLMEEIESCKGANYFFVDNLFQEKSSESLSSLHFFVTPYSIIGEDEIIDIKEFFYKDVQPQILGAMDVLSIENYADVYPLYANNMSLDLTGAAIKGFLNRAPHLSYFNDYYYANIKVTNIDKVGDLDLLNSELEKIGIKSRLDITKYREEKAAKNFPKRIQEMNIEEVVNEIEQKSFLIAQKDTRMKMLKNLWNFVFTIPYNDQNIESNQEILKHHAGEIDYISILGDEYNKSRHFPEYFNCLNDLQQQRVVRCLKALPERNLTNDSFLWSKGFKEVNLDYMNLYKNDAEEFAEYFSSRNKEDKKIILKDIINCDYTNKYAADWLNKNELDLVREVSMDG